MAMASEEEVFTFPRTVSYSSRLAGQFLQLKGETELTDFTVQCSETSFQCHKVILAACSPVLKAMMLSGMSETSRQLVKLDDIPAAVMQQVLVYMYTGDASVPSGLLLPTIKACDFLQLQELKENCQSKAATVCTPDNVISCYKLADSLNIDDLKAKCNEILESYLAEVSKASEFLELSLAEVSSYMSDVQETNVDPDDLLEATMGWVAHDRTTRGNHLLAMMKKIDLTGCSIECLETVIDNNVPLLESQPAVNRILTKGVCQIASKDRVRKRRSKKGQYKPGGKLVVIAGHQKMCLYLDPSMQFQELCAIGNCNSWYSACETPQGFVLTGGNDGSVLCTMFVATTKSWKPLVPLSAVRSHHGSIFMSGKVILLGGLVSGSVSASVQSLELQGGKWQDEPQLLEAVCLPESARVDDELFVLNTWSSTQLFHFDIEQKAWNRKAKFPAGHGHCKGARMVAAQGKLLVAGGNSPTFASYSPGTDTWQTLKPPSLKHNHGALIFHDQKLYLIGGEGESRVEEYNFDSKTWSVCDFKLPWDVWTLQAVALDV